MSVASFGAPIMLIAGIYGFNFSYWGTNFYLMEDIETTIKKVVGRPLIKEKTDKNQDKKLYALTYKKYKRAIEASEWKDYFNKAYDFITGGSILSKWCEEQLKLKFYFLNINKSIAASKWCTVEHTVGHTLILENRELIDIFPKVSKIQQYVTIFEANKDKSEEKLTETPKKFNFKQDVLNGNSRVLKSDDGWKSVDHWCKQVVTKHSDETTKNDNILYQKALQWCVVQPPTGTGVGPQA